MCMGHIVDQNLLQLVQQHVTDLSQQCDEVINKEFPELKNKMKNMRESVKQMEERMKRMEGRIEEQEQKVEGRMKRMEGRMEEQEQRVEKEIKGKKLPYVGTQPTTEGKLYT